MPLAAWGVRGVRLASHTTRLRSQARTWGTLELCSVATGCPLPVAEAALGFLDDTPNKFDSDFLQLAGMMLCLV